LATFNDLTELSDPATKKKTINNKLLKLMPSLSLLDDLGIRATGMQGLADGQLESWEHDVSVNCMPPVDWSTGVAPGGLPLVASPPMTRETAINEGPHSCILWG
jgi:hypothetical protein